MIRINDNYTKLASSYLFSDIAKRISAFQKNNPEKEIIRLGIGDVTLPLPQSCIEAFHRAVDEMGSPDQFKGYGPEQGYLFLREKIAEFDFMKQGADISPEEIFVSDGAKCDTGNFQELFAKDIRVAIPDPVYPVYLDTNVMAGRTGAAKDGRYEGIVYLESTKENDFLPEPPEEPADLIYLCFPNNPTGKTASRETLEKWVGYAKETRSLILFDAAYEAFIRDDAIVRSIYEIEGAKEVAVEFRSFSKTAGFTGTRCAFTVVPKEIRVKDSSGKEHFLHSLWDRRQSTKFNGVSYPVQRAAEAVYSEAGRKEVRRLTDYYLENAALILESFTRWGYACTGGENSPYIWIEAGKDAWILFDEILNQAGVVTTPGDGFGRCGKGYIRVSAFNSHENVKTAINRMENILS